MPLLSRFETYNYKFIHADEARKMNQIKVPVSWSEAKKFEKLLNAHANNYAPMHRKCLEEHQQIPTSLSGLFSLERLLKMQQNILQETQLPQLNYIIKQYPPVAQLDREVSLERKVLREAINLREEILRHFLPQSKALSQQVEASFSVLAKQFGLKKEQINFSLLNQLGHDMTKRYQGLVLNERGECNTHRIGNYILEMQQHQLKVSYKHNRAVILDNNGFTDLTTPQDVVHLWNEYKRLKMSQGIKNTASEAKLVPKPTSSRRMRM